MTNRREFLKTGMRTLAFGGLVLTGAVLGLRKPSGKNADSTCLPQTMCNGCSKLKKCAEPKALEYKKVKNHGQ
jgi:hypothetical protein